MNAMQRFVLEGILPLLAAVMFFVTVIIIIMVVTRSRQRRLELQAEVQSKLIDRFGSATELISFLQSAAGQQFVRGVQSTTTVATRDRVLGGFRRAIVLSCLGLAFLLLWGISGNEGLSWPGVILMALGIGYFGATFVSMKMSQMPVGETAAPSAARDQITVE